MNNNTSDSTAKIISYLKKLESSLRKEIKNGDKLLRQEILKVEERVEDLEEGQNKAADRLESMELGQKSILSQMREQHDEVMTAVSNFAGRVQNLEDENVVGTKHYRDHGKRISKLELKIQSA